MKRSDLPERRIRALLDSIGEAAAQNGLLRLSDTVLALGMHFMGDETRDRVLRLTGGAKAARVRDAIDRHSRMKITYDQYAQACEGVAGALAPPRPADPGAGERTTARPDDRPVQRVGTKHTRPATYYRPHRGGSARSR